MSSLRENYDANRILKQYQYEKEEKLTTPPLGPVPGQNAGEYGCSNCGAAPHATCAAWCLAEQVS